MAQGDFLDQLIELLLKTYGKSHQLGKDHIYWIGAAGLPRWRQVWAPRSPRACASAAAGPQLRALPARAPMLRRREEEEALL